MRTEITKPLIPEVIVDNEWFNANFVRQPDGRLLGHVTYKKWSAEAKRESIKTLDSFDEPVYGAIRNQKLLKYLTSLGFELTGKILACEYPGEEGSIMSEAVYIKGGVSNYCLESYKEEKSVTLPVELVDGWGKVEALEAWLAKQPLGEWKTNHYFSDGVYTRETLIPRGLLFTGYRHKKATVCMIPSGVMSVVVVDELGHATDLGVITGSKVFTTKAMDKKVMYAHEDSIIMNSFPLYNIPECLHNIESVEQIEDFIFEKDV